MCFVLGKELLCMVLVKVWMVSVMELFLVRKFLMNLGW